MGEDSILYDAEEAAVLADLFASAQDAAHGAGSADVLIVMDVDGELRVFSNTTRAFAVFLASAYMSKAADQTYPTPLEDADDD